jgi:hypothetical protein
MKLPQYNKPTDIWKLFDYLSYKETKSKSFWETYYRGYTGLNESISRMSPEDRFTFYLFICESENLI